MMSLADSAGVKQGLRQCGGVVEHPEGQQKRSLWAPFLLSLLSFVSTWRIVLQRSTCWTHTILILYVVGYRMRYKKYLKKYYT